MTTAEVDAIAVRAERDLGIAALAQAQGTACSGGLFRAGGPSPSLGQARCVLGTYFLLWGIIMTLGLLAFWGAIGRFGPRDAGQLGGTLLRAWLPYAAWVFIATAFVLVGLGLIRQRTWARWGGTALALMFLACGIASPWKWTASFTSALIAYVFPILALSVLLSPCRKLTPVD